MVLRVKQPALSPAEMRDMLSYDPETGIFRWKVAPSGRAKPGDRAGAVTKWGYRQIQIKGRKYRCNRLAWYMLYEEWPEGFEIDHVDGDRGNDRFSNLRKATRAENQQNAPKRVTNTSGFKGVFKASKSDRYEAAIRSGGTRLYLGTYDTAEEAHAAYCVAAVEMNGDFARFN